MTSVRLPKKLEEKIEELAKNKKVSKSYVIKEALQDYVAKKKKQQKPYEIGSDLFGQHGSGKGNLSTQYKEKIRKKIDEKKSD